MALPDYGVLIGNKTNYFRDAPDNFGKFYHGNIDVDVNGTSYRCAIDVDSQVTTIQWRIIEFSSFDLATVIAFPNGWHHLVSDSHSGAIDYIRWRPMLVTIVINIPIFLLKWRIRIPHWLIPSRAQPFVKNVVVRNAFGSIRIIAFDQSSFWNVGTNLDAIQQLESVLVQGTKVFVFGQAFTTGHGVHDVHQNQGDPLSGNHWQENAIWQDGATIVQKSNGRYVGFFNKFSTQSFRTDSDGHAI
jgi:hypothetical protein